MRARFGHLVHAVLLLAAAAAIAFLSTRHGVVADWSRSRQASLGAESVAMLKSLDAPVEVICYARHQGGLRAVVSGFVERYRRVKPDLSLRFVDPDADPGAMRDAGVSVDGEIELRYRERSERLKVLGEAEFSNALLRLSRSNARIVAFLEGEGERQPLGKANADLGRFVATQAGRGLHAVPLALASAAKVPDNVDLLVVANPRVALPGSVVDELLDYVERGGALLWLAEPGEPAQETGGGLDRLAQALGLRVLPGTVVDGSGQAFGLGDPSFVAVTRYPPHAITQDFLLTTLFPQPSALARLSDSRWDAQPILRSSAQSWNETGPIPKSGDSADTIRQDDEAGEFAGPLDLGFALVRTSPRPGRAQQRVVVIGDGDFLSNSFLGNGGNRDFGQRVFDWLLGDDAQIRVADGVAPDRVLDFAPATLAALGGGFLLGLPLLLAGSGAWIAWRRRRR